MHLFDSVYQLLQVLRDSHELYCYNCKKDNLIPPRFSAVPHELITHLLFSIRFEKSKLCDLDFLFLEFIRLGYNPFRKDASLTESIMVKSIVKIIDKQRLHYGKNKENKEKNK